MTIGAERGPRDAASSGIAISYVGDGSGGGAVGANNEFAQRSGVLVLAGQHVQQRGPEIVVAAEPVEDAMIEHEVDHQPRGRAVQPVLAILAVAEPIRLPQRAVPRVPDLPARQLDVQIHRDLSAVMQQRGVGDSGRPRLGLGRLLFRSGIRRHQLGLAQLERVGDYFQAVI